MATVITGPMIPVAQMLAQRSGLHLELTTSLRRKGRSMYAIVKHQYGFKGSKARVLQQLEDRIEFVSGIPLDHRFTERRGHGKGKTVVPATSNLVQ